LLPVADSDSKPPAECTNGSARMKSVAWAHTTAKIQWALLGKANRKPSSDLIQFFVVCFTNNEIFYYL